MEGTAMREVIAGALLAATIAATGLAAGVAQADPFSPQPHSWCPGLGLPYRGIEWDMGVCHKTLQRRYTTGCSSAESGEDDRVTVGRGLT